MNDDAFKLIKQIKNINKNLENIARMDGDDASKKLATKNDQLLFELEQVLNRENTQTQREV
jgi:hypothetical protein